VFQAHKFLDHRPELAERIRNLRSAREALQGADWFDINLGAMDRVLELKFSQHLRLADMLYNTGDAELVEDSPTDSFWGIGEDGQGRNELGKALMRLRSRMQAA
jgi:ribA/ribD-fused uncharacterized protein